MLPLEIELDILEVRQTLLVGEDPHTLHPRIVPHHPRTHRVTRRRRRIELDSAVSVAVLYPAACCEVVVIDLRLRTLRRGPEVGDPVRTPEGPLVLGWQVQPAEPHKNRR